jgi:hypothetical protein
LVAGDTCFDYDIYRHSTADAPPAGTPPAVMRVSLGGAGLVHRILDAVAVAAASQLGAFTARLLAPDGRGAPPTVTLWSPQPLGALTRAVAGGKAPKVWRTDRAVSLGPLGDASLLQAPPATPQNDADAAPAGLVVIDDQARSVRFDVPAELTAAIGRPPQAIILHSRAPIGHGPLWSVLTSRPEIADRLILILSADDVRTLDVRVSSGLSWERTAADLGRELAHSPALAAMRRARHVIVRLEREGALWMQRSDDGALAFRLTFDPAHMEGDWERTLDAPGTAPGSRACMVAAIASRCAAARTLDPIAAIDAGIERGLLAIRLLRVLGHGRVGAPPGCPLAELGQLLGGATAGAFFDARRDDGVRWRDLGSFARVTVPVPRGSDTAPRGRWRILETTDAALGGRPLYGKALRIALAGTPALTDVPYARVGRFFTADRDEIESLSAIKRLMIRYAQDDDDRKPLSIAAFGPPGAGKSFGIKQVAEAVVDSKKRGFLEFNLSQFSDAVDLIGAFHQVRDTALDGRLPIVFWDEFDAQGYRWLQFLLAPMQDGKFQEGQITHPIGRCVFVFAGATSYTFEDFGQAVPDFVLKKAPDFKSRLHGYVNVLGPNPRQIQSNGAWRDDPQDVCFPVRRAVLLRSMLGLMDPARCRARLDMDPGLLAAVIGAGHYRHGSRSFEKIVQSLKHASPAGNYRRSGLPADELIRMNVEETDDFLQVLDSAAHFQRHADTLAPAVHARWLAQADVTNIFRKEFEKLDDEAKADNRAAALRIPAILALAGLELVPNDDPRSAVSGAEAILEPLIDVLAKEEHIGWMDVRMKNGWRPVARTEDVEERTRHRTARLHDCLTPYDQLPETERDKDRGSVRWYPKLAALVGFKIVASGFAR